MRLIRQHLGSDSETSQAAPVSSGRELGRLHIHSATKMQTPPGSQRHGCGISSHDPAELIVIITVANCLTRNGIDRCRRQARIDGPRRGCSISHRSQRRLPREKQKAASSTKGVVGRSGSTIPTTPSARLTAPAAAQAMRCAPDLRAPSSVGSVTPRIVARDRMRRWQARCGREPSTPQTLGLLERLEPAPVRTGQE